jgi:hypothetical protein
MPFSHFDNNIVGINGKPFVNFEIEGDMEWMDDEICMALAKADLTKLPMVAGEKPPGMYENRPPFEQDVEKEDWYDDHMVHRRYQIFKRKTDGPWMFIVDLKPNMFRTKDQDLYDWLPISNEMPYLKKFISDKLPLKEIGRVVIYGSWSDSLVPCHRDSPSTEDFSHHINFNPGGYRPVYLYDPIEKTKKYLPEDYKFYAYNVTDYHGVDSLPHFSYTVRVDGKYNDDLIV